MTEDHTLAWKESERVEEEEAIEFRACPNCDGRKVNTRGQRCLECNGEGKIPAEMFD